MIKDGNETVGDTPLDNRTEALKKFQYSYEQALGELATKLYPTDEAVLNSFRVRLLSSPPTSVEFQATVQQALDDRGALETLYQTYARTDEALAQVQDMEF